MSGSYDATVNQRMSNRGPAAAAENRAALLEAARRLLAERGYGVPLSAIAKAAGVSQGVLYRHFPNRVDLALAAFEENFEDLARLAAEDRDDAFTRLFYRLAQLTVEALGFIELVVGARDALVGYDGERRLEQLVADPLARAKRAGLVSNDVTPADVELGVQMVYGAAVTATTEAARRDSVARVRAILDRHWAAVPR